MASKVFLDANCLLDLTLERADFQNSKDVIQLGIKSEVQLYTTPAVLHITAYFTSQSFTHQHTKKIISTLLNNVQVIDCDHATALMAINSTIDDIEDALQYYTALKFDVEYFISSDKKLKKAAFPQLAVYTAAEFLKKFEQP